MANVRDHGYRYGHVCLAPLCVYIFFGIHLQFLPFHELKWC